MRVEAILEALEYLLQKEAGRPRKEREELCWLRGKLEKLVMLARANGELDSYQLIMRLF